jgi:hypothetical protein
VSLKAGDIVRLDMPGSVFHERGAIVVEPCDDGGAWVGVHTAQTDWPLRDVVPASAIKPYDRRAEKRQPGRSREEEAAGRARRRG